MREKVELTRQQMFNSERTLNLHSGKSFHCDPAQCIFPPALPCGRYWSACSLMSVFMATPRLHKPGGKLLTPDHGYNWNNPLGEHWNCGHSPQYYIWRQIELFNMRLSYEQHVKRGQIEMDTNPSYRPPHHHHHNCIMYYIFIINWKWEPQHLALRCNYRLFKDNGA